MQIILKRGPREQQPVLRFELSQGLGKHAFIIFYSLCLVDNHKIIVDFA